jgi:hypothetical protein
MSQKLNSPTDLNRSESGRLLLARERRRCPSRVILRKFQGEYIESGLPQIATVVRTSRLFAWYL